MIEPDGTTKRVPPDQLGVIRNGHLVRLGSDENPDTPWDFSYESEFDKADRDFPEVIDWLTRLPHSPVLPLELADRYQPCAATDTQLRRLTDCVVSLAVRSPCTRQRAASLAESTRGPIKGRERNALIGLNIRRKLRACVEKLNGRAKFSLLVSDGPEFIFGDGFFHNLYSSIEGVHRIKIVAPITPRHAVAIYQPPSFKRDPAICSITLGPHEVDFCNSVVQVYSRDFVYFRHDSPFLHNYFKRRQHLALADCDHFFEQLFQQMPGVIPPRFKISLSPKFRPPVTPRSLGRALLPRAQAAWARIRDAIN